MSMSDWKNGWGFLAFSFVATFVVQASGQIAGHASNTPQYGQYQQSQQHFATRPTVSPYLHLANQPLTENGIPRFGGVYQTLVRPQMEQREFTREQEREIARIQSNVLQIQNQINGQIPTGRPRTGHQSRFMSLSHFYPPVKR